MLTKMWTGSLLFLLFASLVALAVAVALPPLATPTCGHFLPWPHLPTSESTMAMRV